MAQILVELVVILNVVGIVVPMEITPTGQIAMVLAHLAQKAMALKVMEPIIMVIMLTHLALLGQILIAIIHTVLVLLAPVLLAINLTGQNLMGLASMGTIRMAPVLRVLVHQGQLLT